ncbi:MAG: glycosyltransferase family 39 protein [Candidatus Sulfopaludibacter sp.]|nr:glycosyltransferase family 39 protein [Candidatus Sulfopaludibacter sp.]
MRKTTLFFLVLLALLAGSRLCHVHILWEGDTYPLAAARQMQHGRMLYRDIWFDKPPLLPLFYLMWGAGAGWALRLADALYALLACWIAYGFARELWSEQEGLWAAGLLAFFLTFDFPSAVIPVASDLLMVAPHLAAVWMAWKRKPFWAGVLAGVAFWINPKGVFVAAACVLWDPGGALWMAAGFGAVSALMVAALAGGGALGPYWEEVWQWGRLYAGSTFVENPARNALLRTASWAGFHVAIVAAAGVFLWKHSQWKWIGWLALSAIGVCAGLRFFPRYYFLLLPVVVLMAARGFGMMGRKREVVALLLLIPATRFGPTYLTALRDGAWRDTAIDRDSRKSAALLRPLEKPGDTLLVWGYRPELYVYTGLPAATCYLDSQPLTGVPADRHLTSSDAVETRDPGRRRRELVQSRPAFIVDGLGLYNPRLALTAYPELSAWLARYREIGRTGGTIIYALK